MQKLLTGILREFKFRKIEMVSEVDDAIHYFQNNTVDLIFANWGPNSKEARFLNKVRNLKESINPYVPIIIFSSYNEEKYVKLARDLGMNEYLSLPTSPKYIYRHICNIIEKPRTFVESEHFFGPDRRRQQILYAGQERRENTPSTEDAETLTS